MKGPKPPPIDGALDGFGDHATVLNVPDAGAMRCFSAGRRSAAANSDSHVAVNLMT